MTLGKGAYEIIQKQQPALIQAIQRSLNLGESPKNIADKVAMKDIFLAGLVEMAATHMQEMISAQEA